MKNLSKQGRAATANLLAKWRGKQSGGGQGGVGLHSYIYNRCMGFVPKNGRKKATTHIASGFS